MRPGLARTGLLLPAVATEAAAGLLTLMPAAAGPVLAVSAVSAVGVLLCARAVPSARRRVALLAATAALCCGLVAAVVQAQEQNRHPAWLAPDDTVQADVRIDSVRSISSNDHAGALSRRLTLTGTLTAANGRPAAAPLILFADRAPKDALVPGAVLRAELRLRRADPGDSAAYWASAVGPVRLLSAAPWPLRTAAALRAGLVVRASRLPGDGGALLPGLAIGDTSLVPGDLDQAMKDSSLSHLTAVSGANCAVITVAVFALAGLLRLPRWARITVAALALAAFVVLVTPQPSVLRAATMALIALACLGTGRPAAGTPGLSVAVIVLLLLDPWLARSAGFVLSVLATAGLLLLTAPIAERLGRFLPRALALALAVPVAAQLACQPVLVLLQPAVPVFGVAANLLAEPAAPIATIVGLLACLSLPVVPALGSVLTAAAWLPSAWIAGLARIASAMPALPWLAGPAGAVLAFAALGAALLALARAVPAAVRATAMAAVVLLGVAVVGGAVGGTVSRAVATPADWEIAACDVGQGDGLVLNGGGGHIVVVDTGRQALPLRACLARLGVGHIDLLVLTHYDADHVGAARSLAGRVGTVFVGAPDGSASAQLRLAMAAGGARVLQVHRGEQARVGRLRLDVLWPAEPLGELGPGNPASVTLFVTGRLRSIFTGDLGEDAQNALLAAGPVPAVDVVKVAHHGSADQSPAFYAAIGASVGLISCGAGNDYHHPTARLLRVLRADGVQPVRTDQSGLLLVAPAPGGGARVWTERPITADVWTPG
ncbi:MAG: competence protein ComEC [Microbacteriaceae bacterium]|nr:competence protein ComEC [Microbacteriaceae bacterium]